MLPIENQVAYKIVSTGIWWLELHTTNPAHEVLFPTAARARIGPSVQRSYDMYTSMASPYKTTEKTAVFHLVVTSPLCRQLHHTLTTNSFLELSLRQSLPYRAILLPYSSRRSSAPEQYVTTSRITSRAHYSDYEVRFAEVFKTYFCKNHICQQSHKTYLRESSTTPQNCKHSNPQT